MFPTKKCSRKAKKGREYCWQHDPKPRQAKRQDEFLKRKWLIELREARGGVLSSQGKVCKAAENWASGGTADDLVRDVWDLKKAEALVEAVLELGRAEKWTKL